MPSPVRLTPSDRRKILAQLPRTRLGELTLRFELEVSDRRSSEAHVDAIVRKRALDFRRVLELLQRDELKGACEALGLDSTGRDKATLIERILDEPGTSNAAAVVKAPPSSSISGIKANESSVPPPGSARGLGTVKSALRRFVLDTAGGYRGRDAATTFTARLLQCFGWEGDGPPGTSMPTVLSVVDNGQRVARPVALSWPERRVLIEVVQYDVMLDYAWKELLRVCLQVNPAPQYAVLTNQRDLQLYDLGRDRDQPRLSISVDDLPKYSEAFPFLSAHWVPGTTPKIIDVSKVSREVAELVARLYRSLKEQHPKRERDVVQFTLQCILTMFAEDIGLLPKEYFTSLLYEGARKRDVEARLRDMFEVMSTRDVPARVVPYFNGGLFTNAVTLPLGDAQLQAMIKASEANWKYVDPHIFGSVFQGIMDAGERHKHGVHYTAHDDIMRVVGPTIVEPWRQRIRGAKTLTELFEVRAELLKFRVLDPACGSGNFLYVSFRELYRLDTELLARMREFPSTQGEGRNKMTWGAGIQTSSFFGIDINPFAVELAKVTLNIAKKIAFDERKEFAEDIVGQLEMDIDPSLPLDNLDANVLCADALFTPWPYADAIVGNPPMLGDRKIRSELGSEYIHQLQATTGVDGLVDLSCYWFRRAHESLPKGSRAGLVGSSSIRVGKSREMSLDYLVANGGTITNAVSSRPWPGEAALDVSMVNWINGTESAPKTLIVEDQAYSVARVPTHLQLHCDVSEARPLRVNRGGSAMGVIFGSDAFTIDGELLERAVEADCARPLVAATAMLTGTLRSRPEYCLWITGCASELEGESRFSVGMAHLREHVHSMVQQRAADEKSTHHYERWLKAWWEPREPSHKFFNRARSLRRVIACSNPQARNVFVFLSTVYVPNNTLQVFGFEDDYSFGIIQSSIHWEWAKAAGGKKSARTRYTGDVWSTFVWPQEPQENEVLAVAAAARNLRRIRQSLMSANGWSLRALYQAATVAGPHQLNDAQAALDQAVRAAYGIPDNQESTEFLLELNRLVAEDEAEGRSIQGPGVPTGLDARDPRLTSEDCIQPLHSASRDHG